MGTTSSHHGPYGHEDLTSSPPSSGFSPAVPLECPTECWQLKARVALVAGLNPTSHDTSCRQPCSTSASVSEENISFHQLALAVRAQVRFFACRIKPHAPPLVRAPVNSFEFQPCDRTPQAGYLSSYLRHGDRAAPTPSTHRLRPGLPGYLIPFAPLAFVPQRQMLSRKPPSPPVFLPISTHFTAPPGIPLPSPALKTRGF